MDGKTESSLGTFEMLPFFLNFQLLPVQVGLSLLYSQWDYLRDGGYVLRFIGAVVLFL